MAARDVNELPALVYKSCLQVSYVVRDAFRMQVGEGGETLLAQHIVNVLAVVLEEVLGQHSRAYGVAAHRQVLRPPWLPGSITAYLLPEQLSGLD